MKNYKEEKVRSTFDEMVVKVLSSIIPDQKMRLYDGEGNVWTSDSKDLDGMAEIRVYKNYDLLVKIVHDYESGKEKWFYSPIN